MKTLTVKECVTISEITYPLADWDNKGVNGMYRCIFLDGLIKARDEIEKRNRWIPVTEKLPEKRGWYLVSCVGEDENYATVWFFNCVDFGKGKEVTAWKELPEPFKD